VATRRGGFRPRQGPRSVRDWGVGPTARNVGIAGDGKAIWTNGVTPNANFTILRTHGIVSVVLTAAASAGDGFLGAHGIFMATEDSFAIGVTAMLDPFNDANSDMWFWHSFFDVRAITATLSDGVNAVTAVSRIVIDSKAMRKGFDPERVLVGVTSVVESGVAVCEVNADTRMLFMS